VSTARINHAEGQPVRFKERLTEIRRGFEPAFWVANITELFERVAYYGQAAVVAIFLHESLHLSTEQTGTLMGWVGFVVWFLPILGGSLADRFGFRKTLALAYLTLAAGYFLMGSLASGWMAPLREALPLFWVVLLVLMIPALGPSVVKPVVAGTTARASSESVRSIGYSIYYTLVNIGGTIGPIVAFLVRRSLGIENVFRVSALLVFLMFFATLLFYKEPSRGSEQAAPSLVAAIRNMLLVLGKYKLFLIIGGVAILVKVLSLLIHFSVPLLFWLALLVLALATLSRFMWFLVIFSGFWIIFWQEFISLPLFLRGYVNPNANFDLLLSVDPATVILFQIVVSYLTRRIPAFKAMTLGILISSFSWLVLVLHASTGFVIAALFILALGEITQSPRYYEYVSRLAPPGQQGTYMGYAFLPIAIGYLIGGKLGGYLVHYFGDVLHRPEQMWWVVSAIGFATALLMWIYNIVVKPVAAADSSTAD
jgi:proton-dependent oligopeptide transporter, POT family